MSPPSSPKLLASLKSIDAHPKVSDDFAQQTSIGGVISAAAAIVMVTLFISELRTHVKHMYFRQQDIHRGLSDDDGQA